MVKLHVIENIDSKLLRFTFMGNGELVEVTKPNETKVTELLQQNVIKQYQIKDDINLDELLEFDSMNPRNQEIYQVSIDRLVRDTKLARELKARYHNTCQLCGTIIKGRNSPQISEAHHIKPYNKSHKGDDTFQNMIILCPNCHAQFDQLYYAINPETEEVHCVDESDPRHGSRLIMNEDHHLGKKYLTDTWALFIESRIEKSI